VRGIEECSIRSSPAAARLTPATAKPVDFGVPTGTSATQPGCGIPTGPITLSFVILGLDLGISFGFSEMATARLRILHRMLHRLICCECGSGNPCRISDFRTIGKGSDLHRASRNARAAVYDGA